MTRFFFVRHGESVANSKNLIATLESPLTDKGLEQARKTGNELKNKSITKIVCSPFIRTQQTAEIIAGELGIPIDHIEIMDELQERRFGKKEGTPKEHPSEFYYTFEGPEIEPRDTLLKRVKTALSKVKKISDHEVVLAVGHGCSGFYMLQVAKGNTELDKFEDAHQMSNADFVEVEV